MKSPAGYIRSLEEVMKKKNSSLSRKDFLIGSAIIGVTSFIPNRLYAEDSVNKSPDECWKDFENQALSEGSKIIQRTYSGSELVELSSRFICNTYKNFTASQSVVVGLTPETLYVVAVVDNNDPKIVGPLINTWVHFNFSTVTNMTYKASIIEGGSVLGIHYTFTVKSPVIGNISTWTCYVEFYPNGASWLSVG